MVTMSAADTRTTKATRREVGTELPKITASNEEAGIPKSELRQSARMTWSRQAARAAGLSGIRLTRAISGDRAHPLTTLEGR